MSEQAFSQLPQQINRTLETLGGTVISCDFDMTDGSTERTDHVVLKPEILPDLSFAGGNPELISDYDSVCE